MRCTFFCTTSVFWEDGKSLQRLVTTQPKQLRIMILDGGDDITDSVKVNKIVRFREPSSTIYFDKEGFEITREAFQRKYPGILPKGVKVKF